MLSVIPEHRDPRINRPWFACGDIKADDFGHLWAEEGLAPATMLFFDKKRSLHACSVDHQVVEGEIIDLHGRDWVCTWADMDAMIADRRPPTFDDATLARMGFAATMKVAAE